MEYTYPKVTTIAFKDFRSLGDVVIDMTQSPIIALKGKSEVGKSSVSYGIRLMGTNIGQRKHKEFIRDGAQCWKILIKFEDGTAITRTKTTVGQQFTMYQPDETGKLKLVWSVDKLDENDIPKEVQKYMGFCFEAETKEVLNVRLYKNLMLFVDTASSTNYKVMYNALKVDGISKAVQIGTKEANKLNNKATELNTSIKTCQEQLRQIHIVNTEPLTKIRVALEGRLNSYEKVEGIRNRQLELQKIQHLSHVAEQLRQIGTVDEGLVTTLNRSHSILTEVRAIQSATGTYQQVQNLQLANIDALQLCEDIKRRKEELSQVNTSKLELLSKITPIEEAKEEVLSNFEKLLSKKKELDTLNQAVNTSVLALEQVNEDKLTLLNKIKSTLTQIAHVDEVYQGARKQADEYHKLLHESGVLYGTCPKCGETVVIQNQ